MNAKVNKAGDTMTGKLTVPTFQMTTGATTGYVLGCADALGNAQWVASSVSTGTYVLKAGDTMTGDLTAPNFNANYGVNASTGIFNKNVIVGNNLPSYDLIGSVLDIKFPDLTSDGNIFNICNLIIPPFTDEFINNEVNGYVIASTNLAGGNNLGRGFYQKGQDISYGIYTEANNNYHAGKLGIGIELPTQKLEVNGNIKSDYGVITSTFQMTTGATAGYILACADNLGHAYWVVNSTGTGGVSSVNGQTGVVVLNTDNIAEGTTNQYFTPSRVWTVVNSSMNAKVNKAGDTMTGNLTVPEVYTSTINAMNTNGLFLIMEYLLRMAVMLEYSIKTLRIR
jgi:hypothetical protein